MSDQLSPLDAQELAGLRVLLQESVRASQRASAVYRIFGVIMLDACNERAMNIGVRALGVDYTDFQNFDGMKSRLQQHLQNSWKAPYWRDVLRLHNARNLAQHHGIPSTPEGLPLWRAATEQFVKSLVRAVFGVTLDEVRLSDALSDGELKAQFVSAEEAFVAGRLQDAQSRAYSAYDSARRRWERVTKSSRISLAKPPRRDGNEPGLRWLKERVEQLEASSQETRFAGNTADTEWFLRTRREGIGLLNRDEVRRLLSFVFFCLIEWEAIAPDLSLDWRDRGLVAQRNVRESDEPARAKDVRAERSATYDGSATIIDEHYNVYIEIENVPVEPHFDRWVRLLVAEMRTRAHFKFPTVTGAGIIKFEIPLELQHVEGVMYDVHDALSNAELQLEQELTQAARLEADLLAEREAYSATLNSCELPGWVANISCCQDYQLAQNVVLVQPVQSLAKEDIEPLLREISINASSLWRERSAVITAPLPSPNDLISRLEEMTPVLESMIESRKSTEQLSSGRTEALNATFRSALERARSRVQID